MDDSEVERLRRLRGCALLVRAVARALEGRKCTLHDALFPRSRCAAWRIARAATGRLRAHPYARFQKDAGVGILLKNSVVAKTAALGASSRPQALGRLVARLRALSRELDDARALTWAADLSDSFGRSQREVRSLIATIEHEVRGSREPATRVSLDPQRRTASVVGTQAPERAVAAAEDWPYLAF
jgi:hypothetical protein